MSVSGTHGSREAQHSRGLHDMVKCPGGFNLRVLVNTSMDIPSQAELLKSALVQKEQRSSGLAGSPSTAPAARGSSQQGGHPVAALAGQSVARIAAESLASQRSFSKNHLEHTKSSPTELAGATSHVGWRC